MKAGNSAKVLLGLGLAACVLVQGLSGCARSIPLRAKVIDSVGNPVPGALVYVEAWKHPGSYDFTFGIADDSGQVRPEKSDAAALRWKPGARLAYAAFAEGYTPFAAIDYKGGEPPAILHIQLQAGEASASTVAKLGFPFPGQADLAARAAAPEAAPVRAAFLKAYRQPGMHILPEDLPKREALEKAQADGGN